MKYINYWWHSFFGKNLPLSFKKILSKRIIIFSRDESKQYEMQNDSSFKKYKKALRFL